jgi:hypothetical protein
MSGLMNSTLVFILHKLGELQASICVARRCQTLTKEFMEVERLEWLVFGQISKRKGAAAA